MVISAILLDLFYIKLYPSSDYRFTFAGVLSLSRSRCFRFRLVVPFGSSKSIRENSHICVSMQSDPNIKAGNILAAVTSTIQIDVTRNTVSQLSFSHVHTTIEQVDDCFFTAILNHLQAADRNCRCVLGDTELCRTTKCSQGFVNSLPPFRTAAYFYAEQTISQPRRVLCTSSHLALRVVTP